MSGGTAYVNASSGVLGTFTMSGGTANLNASSGLVGNVFIYSGTANVLAANPFAPPGGNISSAWPPSTTSAAPTCN